MGMTLEKAREFFGHDIYATKTTGVVIEEVRDDYAKCSLELDERHCKVTGEVMGGAIFTLADFTFAVASNNGGVETVSTVTQISYMSVAKGKKLYGESRMLKNGRKVCFYEIMVTDELGTKVAVVNMTGIHTGRTYENI